MTFQIYTSFSRSDIVSSSVQSFVNVFTYLFNDLVARLSALSSHNGHSRRIWATRKGRVWMAVRLGWPSVGCLPESRVVNRPSEKLERFLYLSIYLSISLPLELSVVCKLPDDGKGWGSKQSTDSSSGCVLQRRLGCFGFCLIWARRYRTNLFTEDKATNLFLNAWSVCVFLQGNFTLTSVEVKFLYGSYSVTGLICNWINLI